MSLKPDCLHKSAPGLKSALASNPFVFLLIRRAEPCLVMAQQLPPT